MRPINHLKLYLLLVSYGGMAVCSRSSAQESANPAGQVSISSPTASALGKYGDIPVGYHTGTPNISVPVYTVQSGSLHVPVGLNYHASGLKVQEQASWVGAGWSLDAGGVITRTVRGAADDKGYQGYQGFGNRCTNGHYSDYGYNSYMMVGRASSVLPDGKGTDDHFFAQGYKDGEPDLFFFNFGGYSGKFYFNDDRTPVIVPEQDIRIQADYSLGPGFNGFILTTPDGVKYYFGRTGNYSSPVDPVELTIPSTITQGPANGDAAASSWYLNKVVSPQAMDSITFQYQAESYSYYTWSMFPITNYAPLQSTPAQDNGTDLVKNYVNGVRLSRISFATGKIDFVPSAAPRTDLSAGYAESPGMNDLNNTNSYSLGSINISDNAGFCKKYSLYYSYFADNVNTDFSNTFWGLSLNVYNLHSDLHSLRLDSVQEQTCDAALNVPSYRFSYFGELVPRKLSFGIDHWGFYNGATNNSNLIPAHTVKYQGTYTQKPGANREAAWPAMRGGTLQSIRYPTGGMTTFDYEGHSTYCNASKYVRSGGSGPSVGFDGSTQSSTPFTTSGNGGVIYDFELSSSLTSGSGNLEIHDPSNNIVQNFAFTNGSTISKYVQLSPGTTYTLQLFKNSSDGSGKGLSVSIYQWTPTPVTGNVLVGGLRIKAITTTDGFGSAPRVSNYTYNAGNNTAGNSSGILYSKPTYVKLVKNSIYQLVFPYPPTCQLYLCGSTDGGACANASDQYYKSPTSVRPMETTQGGHIGYNEVYVSTPGNGYSVYRYYGSNIWDNNVKDVCTRMADWDNPCDPDIPNTPADPVPFEFMRGQLKYEGHFNEGGNILRSVAYFPVFQPSGVITPCYTITSINSGELYDEYTWRSARKVSDSSVETMYDPGNNTAISQTKAVYYGSVSHHQPTRQVAYASAGATLVTNTKYAFDFQVAACDALDNAITSYAANAHADSVNFQNTLNTCTPQSSTTPAIQNCRYIGIQQFRENMSNHRIQYIQTRRANFTDPSNQFDIAHATAKNAADVLLKPILSLQDEYNNAPVELSDWKNNNLRRASFIQYNSSVSPAGFADPGRTQLVSLQTPSAVFTNAAVSGNSIVKDSRYQDETNFVFSKGNPQQVTAHDGIPNSYVWDDKNTRPIAKVVNATVDQVAFSSFETDGNGGWAVPSTLRGNSGITGQQSYNLSNGACQRTGINTSGTSIVTYWSRSGQYTVTGDIAHSQGKTVNGWTYYEHRVTGFATISVSGSGDIDELRIYPAGSLMTTYVYAPLTGMISECDVNNRITYYDYDGLGRLQVIKDQDGNIIKTIDYHYKGQ